MTTVGPKDPDMLMSVVQFIARIKA
jgi:hypothetical protein